MLLDITQANNQLHISYFNINGETAFKVIDLKREDLFNWVVCDERDTAKDPKMKNWDGRPVKKSPTRYLNKFRMHEMLKNMSVSDRALIFEYNYPKTYFIDIEVEVNDEFPDPALAKTPVTAICIVTPSDQAVVLATRDLSQRETLAIQKQIDKHFESLGRTFSFIYKKFESEYDMLYTFLTHFVKKFPLMTGWNVINFDWSYIYHRAKRLNIDPSIGSPTGELFKKNNLPQHVGCIDYMDIYKRWDRSVDIKEDFKLDTAGESVVGIKKVKYDGSLQQLYEKDYSKYIFYNVIDTCLVKLIHEKIRTLDIALTISHISEISIAKCDSPVAIAESLLCKGFLDINRVMAVDPERQGKTHESYEGAFVKEPIIGKHNDVACFDFASLYPSIMRELNISPESFIKKVNADERAAAMKDDVIVSVSGAIYSKEISVLYTILTDLYTKRRTYKKKSFELQQLAYDMEHNK